mmetsp:Transcript_6638/g.23723  ORF Transcript_6638/g.23723 Transcript_6638/m.23723 type:complete len:248 (+) Transcript_6638:1264-2007(+)
MPSLRRRLTISSTAAFDGAQTSTRLDARGSSRGNAFIAEGEATVRPRAAPPATMRTDPPRPRPPPVEFLVEPCAARAYSSERKMATMPKIVRVLPVPGGPCTSEYASSPAWWRVAARMARSWPGLYVFSSVVHKALRFSSIAGAADGVSNFFVNSGLNKAAGAEARAKRAWYSLTPVRASPMTSYSRMNSACINLSDVNWTNADFQESVRRGVTSLEESTKPYSYSSSKAKPTTLPSLKTPRMLSSF